MMKVYHKVWTKEPCLWPRDYVLVAIVEGDDPEIAFSVTNNTYDHRVEWVARGRSTSVGDVVVLSDGTVFQYDDQGTTLIIHIVPHGELYQVQMQNESGWINITDKPVCLNDAKSIRKQALTWRKQ